MYKKCILFVLAVLLCAGCAKAPASETATPGTLGSTLSPIPTVESTQSKPSQLAQTVLVDNDDLLFKIISTETNAIWGYTWKIYLENRTNQDLMFSLQDVSVNGYMCDPYFATTVNAGMKANKEISFLKEQFQQIGIKEVTQVEFTLQVYDANDWTEDAIWSETYRLYPLGEAADKEYPRQEMPEDIVLFDNDVATMIITGFEPDSIWGYSANVYLVNKTDDTLMFSVGEASVNGFMCNPYFAKSVTPGKQCITSISWSKNALEENGITKVQELRLPIRVYEADEWEGEYLLEETFTVKP